MSELIERDTVLDTIHRFFTEEVDKIPTKKTEDGEVLIMCKAQPLFAMNKTLCKRIKELPSVSPTQNCVGNTLDALDCIDREQAIKALDAKSEEFPEFAEAIYVLEELPSVTTVSDLIKDIKDWINTADEMGYQVTYDDLFQFLDKWGDADE